jgi:peptidoglycan/LPS O-acetylase OafA/YrhL
MKPVVVNFLNALVLIAAGLYGYFMVAASDGTHSKTALIPAAFGLLFIILGAFWAKAPKVVSHIIVVLTLVLLIMCSMRFAKVEGWNEKKYLFLACIISNAIALIVFIKSFIDARKNRA